MKARSQAKTSTEETKSQDSDLNGSSDSNGSSSSGSQIPNPHPLGLRPLGGSRFKLPWPLNLYQSDVGKKWVMALTGLSLLGFVVVHMIGNLHLYEGPTETYEYAEQLRDLGGHLIPRTWILWALRFGLIGAFALHIHSAYYLSRKNLVANRLYQGGRKYQSATYASRTMRWTGPIIGFYVLYHLADLTWGHLNPDFVRGDPYHNVVSSLANVPVTILYIVANVALAMHIAHGAWSIFQSLGVNSPRFNHLTKYLARAIALAILVGNLSFPIFVQAGVIDDDGDSVVEALEEGFSGLSSDGVDLDGSGEVDISGGG